MDEILSCRVSPLELEGIIAQRRILSAGRSIGFRRVNYTDLFKALVCVCDTLSNNRLSPTSGTDFSHTLSNIKWSPTSGVSIYTRGTTPGEPIAASAPPCGVSRCKGVSGGVVSAHVFGYVFWYRFASIFGTKMYTKWGSEPFKSGVRNSSADASPKNVEKCVAKRPHVTQHMSILYMFYGINHKIALFLRCVKFCRKRFKHQSKN